MAQALGKRKDEFEQVKEEAEKASKKRKEAEEEDKDEDEDEDEDEEEDKDEDEDEEEDKDEDEDEDGDEDRVVRAATFLWSPDLVSEAIFGKPANELEETHTFRRAWNYGSPVQLDDAMASAAGLLRVMYSIAKQYKPGGRRRRDPKPFREEVNGKELNLMHCSWDESRIHVILASDY